MIESWAVEHGRAIDRDVVAQVSKTVPTIALEPLIAATVTGQSQSSVPTTEEVPAILPDPSVHVAYTWEKVKSKVDRVKPAQRVSEDEIERVLSRVPIVEDKDVKDQDDERFLTRDISGRVRRLSVKQSMEKRFTKLFKPRSKSDMSQRRSRYYDWYFHFHRLGRLSDLRELLSFLSVDCDYIMAMNLLCYTAVYGMDWARRWFWLGALDQGAERWGEAAKVVNNVIKTRGLNDPQWRQYVESGGLVGYRNLPYPGFDLEKQARELADGGNEHYTGKQSWAEACRKYLKTGYQMGEYLSFETFVRSGDWLTSGSCSVGHLIIEVVEEGKAKQYKIKCRKNMVLDVLSMDELWRMCVEQETQVNTVVIKSELGKVRLAVAGDVVTYLRMSWVNKLMYGAYKGWEGSTIEETLPEMTVRLNRMLQLVCIRYSLPYDFAAFDHQPTTEELIAIFEVLFELARINVPAAELAAFRQVCALIVTGMRNATLKVHVDGQKGALILGVKGGLMSGLRWTTVVGNAWNTVITGLAMQVMREAGAELGSIERYIRGDDSAIFTATWAQAATINVGYKSVGALGGDGKYSILLGATEFLRTWFADRCYGYPSRVIPALTERKPWNPDPWEEAGVLRAQYDTIRTLRRRAPECLTRVDEVWQTLKLRWCEEHHLPLGSVTTPAELGGLGIESSELLTQCIPRIPRVDKIEGVTLVNQNQWRATGLMARAQAEYNISLPSEQAQVLAEEQLLSVLAADDVRYVAKQARTQWREVLKTLRPKVVKLPQVSPPSAPANLEVWGPNDIGVLQAKLKREAPLFGCCPEVATARADHALFAPEQPFKVWLHTYFPKVSVRLHDFHRSWHLSERLDYLEGKAPIAPSILHPELVGILTYLTAKARSPHLANIRGTSTRVARNLEREVNAWTVSQRCYQW